MKEVPMGGAPAVPDPKAPIPRQIRYIIGNEGCERFSFYGMRNILTVVSRHVAADVSA
jgi:proton-dependent oligopeptide transporter, POT family